VYATALVHWVQYHRCDVRLRLYGMIYLPSASAMDVKLQSHPPADEWRKTGLSRGGTGEGPAWEVFLVESWRDVSVRMRHAIEPRENAFPTRSPPLWLSTGLEVYSKSLSQSIRLAVDNSPSQSLSWRLVDSGVYNEVGSCVLFLVTEGTDGVLT